MTVWSATYFEFRCLDMYAATSCHESAVEPPSLSLMVLILCEADLVSYIGHTASLVGWLRMRATSKQGRCVSYYVFQHTRSVNVRQSMVCVASLRSALDAK